MLKQLINFIDFIFGNAKSNNKLETTKFKFRNNEKNFKEFHFIKKIVNKLLFLKILTEVNKYLTLVLLPLMLGYVSSHKILCLTLAACGLTYLLIINIIKSEDPDYTIKFDKTISNFGRKQFFLELSFCGSPAQLDAFKDYLNNKRVRYSTIGYYHSKKVINKYPPRRLASS